MFTTILFDALQVTAYDSDLEVIYRDQGQQN